MSDLKEQQVDEVLTAFTFERVAEETQGQRLSQAKKEVAEGTRTAVGQHEGRALPDSYLDVLEEESAYSHRLHGVPTSTTPITQEKVAHRLVLILKLQGRSNKEIAPLVGYGENWVSQITRQPWFKLEIAQMLTEAGEDSLNGLLKREMSNCVYKLIEIRDDPEAPVAQQRAATVDLMDRFFGKPVAKVENFDGGKIPSASNVDKIDAALSTLDNEINRLSGQAQPKNT